MSEIDDVLYRLIINIGNADCEKAKKNNILEAKQAIRDAVLKAIKEKHIDALSEVSEEKALAAINELFI